MMTPEGVLITTPRTVKDRTLGTTEFADRLVLTPQTQRAEHHVVVRKPFLGRQFWAEVTDPDPGPDDGISVEGGLFIASRSTVRVVFNPKLGPLQVALPIPEMEALVFWARLLPAKILRPTTYVRIYLRGEEYDYGEVSA